VLILNIKENFVKNKLVMRLIFVSLVAVLNSACSNIMHGSSVESLGVTLTGVHHMGRDYTVDQFYVDSSFGGNVGRGGGGGSYACCMMLPEKWREDLTVVVKWSVSNWMNANSAETAIGNFSSVKDVGNYIATVPIEKYENAGNLYAHFFPNGKVRVVSSTWGVLQDNHPVKRNRNEEATASQGVLIPILRRGGSVQAEGGTK
jgi:hypothetical protein